MSEAPETIWAGTAYGESCGVDWSEIKAFASDVKYRRADLPATDEQAFANEKVKALVEALKAADRIEELQAKLAKVEAKRDEANNRLGIGLASLQVALGRAEAALPRAYQMGLDAAAEAIRALRPYADLVERVKGGE